MNKLLFLIFSCLVICTYDLTAQSVHLEDIDEKVHQALETFQVPGVAVGIIVDGQVVLAKGYGLRHIEQNSPVTEKTLFPIASCTKAFTAYLIHQLVEEGKVSWDDPVMTYLPEFHLVDEERTAQVTIRDLIAHRTGIPRHDGIWFCAKITPTEVLKRLPFLESANGLREKMQYSNLMYTIAGVLIERVTGQTWEEAIASRILTPLDMKETLLDQDLLFSREDFSYPYAKIQAVLQEIPFHLEPVVKPGGGIISTVSDMALWVRFQLENSQALQEMQTVHMPVEIESDEDMNALGYGLGWFICRYKGHSLVRHGGDIDGFSSEVAFLPQDNMGLVILTNSSTNGRYLTNSLRNYVLDTLLQKDNTHWIDKELKKQQSEEFYLHLMEISQPINHSPQHPLDYYCGFYEHPGHGTVEIRCMDDQLVAFYGNSQIPLYCRDQNTFMGSIRELLYFGLYREIDFTFYDNALHARFEPVLQPLIFHKSAKGDNLQ